MSTRVYLDFAAAAPTTKNALRAFNRAIGVYGNPSAAHAEGRAARIILEEARATIAHMAGTKPEALIFTSGATEANAIVIRGHVRARLLGGARPEDLHLLYVEGAHASVHETMRALALEGIAVDTVSLREGDIDVEMLATLIRPETTLISVEAIASETGARFDTRSVRRVLDDARSSHVHRIALHVDASQLPLVESFERTRLAADFLTLDAQKVGGVRGCGALIFAPNISLAPIIEGGGQERGLRSGTESPALAASFAAALLDAEKARAGFVARAKLARARLAHDISSAIAHTNVNEGKKNAPHILNVSFLGRDTDYLVALLDERGFSVSTRSACESDSVEGSRAVRALTGDIARATSTLRISWGPTTSTHPLQKFVDALQEAVSFIDQNQP